MKQNNLLPQVDQNSAVPSDHHTSVRQLLQGHPMGSRSSAVRLPLPDDPAWIDFVDDDFIQAVVEVGAELPDADDAPPGGSIFPGAGNPPPLRGAR